MAIKIVVVGSAQLPAGDDFPPLKAAKYSWDQYPAMTGENIVERCWRADIVVALITAIELTTREKMPRFKLLIVAAEAARHLDQEVVQENGVELLIFPAAQCKGAVEAEVLCKRISQAIDQYIRNYENKGVSP